MNRVVKLLMPFVNRTVFLWFLGADYLGLNGLFGSIFGMLSLAEFGFGTAIDVAMYKAVAEDDEDRICAYLGFYRTIYRWVGVVTLAGGLCLLPFIGHFIHGDTPPDISLTVVYLLHLLNSSVSYFFFAARRSILGIYNRKDVISNVDLGLIFTKQIAVLFVLLFTRNYYIYVATLIAFSVLWNLSMFWAARRLFPRIRPRGTLPDDIRRKTVSSAKSIFMHKIGGLAAFGLDNLVVSSFIGLTAVAVYGNYFYVSTSASYLVGILGFSMLSAVGNRIHTESRADNFRLFMKSSRLMTLLAVWSAAMMAALFQPFITVWVGGKPGLVRHALTPALVVAFFYVNQSRQAFQMFKSAANLWRKDRWKPIVSAAVNLALSLAMVKFLPDAYKLDGVILSTVLAFVVVEYPWESHVLFTAFFTREQGRVYWRMQGGFALAAVAASALAWGAVRLVPVAGIPGFFLKAAVAAVATTAFLAVVFRRDVQTFLGTVRPSGGRRNGT